MLSPLRGLVPDDKLLDRLVDAIEADGTTRIAVEWNALRAYLAAEGER